MNEKISKSRWNPMNWRLGEYTRQLSVVVLGIVITFLGSAAISAIKERKEVRTTLSFVKSELEENKATLIETRQRIELEVAAARFLLHYKNNLQAAPADSLSTYYIVPFQATIDSYSSDALELMKTSGIFPKLSDEYLGLDIIKTYNEIRVASDFYRYFSKTKDEGLKIIMANLDNKLILFEDRTPVEIWNYVFKVYETEVMLRQTCFVFNVDYINQTIKSIDATLEAIDAYL